MRVLKKDLRGGTIKLLVENGDDLWHLRHLIEPGDLVHAVTWRREERSTDMVRAEKTERRRQGRGDSHDKDQVRAQRPLNRRALSLHGRGKFPACKSGSVGCIERQVAVPRSKEQLRRPVSRIHRDIGSRPSTRLHRPQ